MTNRRQRAQRAAAAAATGALLLTAVALGSPNATAATDNAGRASGTATLTVLPGISQQGKGTASPAAAKIVISAKVAPVQVGRPATLERLDADGVTWVPVSTATVGKTAKAAEFSADPGLAGSSLRVTFAAYSGQPAVSTDPAPASLWPEANFTDEFAGGSLGHVWSHRGTGYNPKGLRRCSKGSSKAAKVGGGTLQLSVLLDKAKKKKQCVAKRGNGKKIGKFKYRLNGHVATQGQVSLRYGVVAARMKFQKSAGQHASFWLQPNVHNPKAKDATTGGAEIDVIEWFGTGGKESGLTSFIYHPSKKGPVKVGGFLKNDQQFLANKSDKWWKSYHVFSVEWTPAAYVFRIDGKESLRITKGISAVPQFLILSMLSSDYELPKLKNEKKLPQKFNVDWVRVWQNPAYQ